MAPGAEETTEKKKVLIGAEYVSPGPARYFLPTTLGTKSVDNTKKHAPSFTFGSRFDLEKNPSPGPAYSIDGSFTARGRAMGPSYSFGGRVRTPKRFISPGPGAYSTDMKPPREANAPAYSLSPRTTNRKMDYTPSPNAYSLPSTIGPNVPGQKGGYASSIQGKNTFLTFNTDLSKSPGPASYFPQRENGTIKNSPAFTFGGRFKPHKFDNHVPGPGAYSPENVDAHITRSPRYQIGAYHSQYKMPVISMANVSD